MGLTHESADLPPEHISPVLQKEIAGFAEFAATATSLSRVLHEACVVAARGVDSRFSKVLRHLHQEQQFILVAGIGWKASEIGTVRVGAGLESPAGYAFITAQPVVSMYLSRESRFKTPHILLEHGIKSALNVQISMQGKPVGVLEVDSQIEREFFGHHVAFIEALAGVVSLSLERLPDPGWVL